jgi:hypothetical protein
MVGSYVSQGKGVRIGVGDLVVDILRKFAHKLSLLGTISASDIVVVFFEMSQGLLDVLQLVRRVIVV